MGGGGGIIGGPAGMPEGPPGMAGPLAMAGPLGMAGSADVLVPWVVRFLVGWVASVLRSGCRLDGGEGRGELVEGGGDDDLDFRVGAGEKSGCPEDLRLTLGLRYRPAVRITLHAGLGYIAPFTVNTRPPVKYGGNVSPELGLGFSWQ